MDKKYRAATFIPIVAAVVVILIGILPTGAVVVPNSQSATDTSGVGDYRVGYMENAAATGYSDIMNAFTGAFGSIGDGYNPTSHVTQADGYYSQTYADNNGRNASIYVGDDKNAYSVGWPLYDSWSSVGGVSATGYPTANAYSVGDEYYQNFSNGYVRYTDADNVSFVQSKSVDENGTEMSGNSIANRARTGTENGTTSGDTTNGITTNDTTNGTANNAENNTNNNTTNNITNNGNAQLLSGVGADASGAAGSLERSAEINPVIAIVGLIILAAIIIILVAMSAAAARSRD